MEQGKFATILSILVGSLANKIIVETGEGEDETFNKLYNSQLYAMLEDEATKVWTYSIPQLFDLYQQEMIVGILALPEY